MKPYSLPLGIDIGTTRLRIVHAHMTGRGARVSAIAVRDICAGSASSGAVADPQYVATLLEDALAELRTRERRCICAVGEPEARLRVVTLPKMTALERERSARFEAHRHIDFPLQEAVVRVHPLDAAQRLWALGIVRSSAMQSRVAALRGAKLLPRAMDFEGCALARALPDFDAIVDIGLQRASLHVTGSAAPETFQTFNGGADITRGIQRELSLDEATAEKRKRILGTAGAGERARAGLAGDIAALVQNARHASVIRRVALVGNGSRLPGLRADLEAATGLAFTLPISEVLHGENYPQDVVSSSAPDLTLAAGLAAWGSTL